MTFVHGYMVAKHGGQCGETWGSYETNVGTYVETHGKFSAENTGHFF